jgi:hypothetical protein
MMIGACRVPAPITEDARGGVAQPERADKTKKVMTILQEAQPESGPEKA